VATSFSPVDRLCYIGSRGMGALQFEPAISRNDKVDKIEVAELVGLAGDMLRKRTSLTTNIHGKGPKGIEEILKVGSSAGGARPKAIIAYDEQTGEVRTGQAKAPRGFGYWIIKLDGVSGNALGDPKGYGRIEYAYHLMAKSCDIEMAECRLLEEGPRAHFMTRRFDRSPDGSRLHQQTLCGIAHYSFNDPDSYSYEQAFGVMRQLKLPYPDAEQLFRRMVFNVVARNQDDHVKNIAFLMDKAGHWSLAPAFDVTYSYNPAGSWTDRHQMTMNGKRDGFTLADFRACGKSALMKRGRAEAIVEEVRAAVAKWPDYAEQAQVMIDWREQIQRSLRLKFPRA